MSVIDANARQGEVSLTVDDFGMFTQMDFGCSVAAYVLQPTASVVVAAGANKPAFQHQFLS